MTDIVDETLRLWRSTVFEWSETDCMLSVGDYVAQRGGKDVTSYFRGMYDTKEHAIAIMAHCGGAAAMIAATGIPRVPGPPERGDVVTLAVGEDDGGAIAGICTGGMVAARRSRGVIEVQTRLVRLGGIWRCPS